MSVITLYQLKISFKDRYYCTDFASESDQKAILNALRFILDKKLTKKPKELIINKRLIYDLNIKNESNQTIKELISWDFCDQINLSVDFGKKKIDQVMTLIEEIQKLVPTKIRINIKEVKNPLD